MWLKSGKQRQFGVAVAVTSSCFCFHRSPPPPTLDSGTLDPQLQLQQQPWGFYQSFYVLRQSHLRVVCRQQLSPLQRTHTGPTLPEEAAIL